MSYGYSLAADVIPTSVIAAQAAVDLAKIRRNAVFIGLGIGAAGALAGGLVGRWAGKHRPIATIGGAAVGGAGLGIGSFFVIREVMVTGLEARVAAQTQAQQQAINANATGATQTPLAPVSGW